MTIRLSIILFFLYFNVSLKSQELSPESAKSIELLKRSWECLDSISAKIYPDWNNYRKIPVFIGLPKRQGVFVNPDRKLPNGFLQIKTDTVLKIFVRDTSNVKFIGGGIGVKIDDIYFNKYLKLDSYTPEFNDDNISFLKKYFLLDTIPDSLIAFMKTQEYYISISSHEAFHIFQLRSKPLHNFTKDINYLKPEVAALSYIEGILLSEALESNSDETTKELVSRFISVKEFKNTKLSRRQLNYEKDYQWLEGVATYAQVELLKRIIPESRMKCLIYIDSMNLQSSIVNLYEAGNKDYYYGEAQAYLLDRLYGQTWKIKILSPKIYFIDLLKEAVEYDKENKRQLLHSTLETFQYKAMKRKIKEQFKKGNIIINQQEYRRNH